MKIGKDSSPATKRCFFTCLLSLYLLFGSLTSGFAASEANMQKAILSGNAAKVQEYLKEGFYVESILPNKKTPLTMATAEGKKEIVQILLTAGANPNLKVEGGSTALYLAAQRGYRDILELLIKAGADVNLSRDDGYTPLIVAAINGEIASVELLLKAGANVNYANNVGLTALMMAASNGYPEEVELLINYGADVNAFRKDNKWTALLYAICFTNYYSNATPANTVRTAAILLDRGADVNVSGVGFTNTQTQTQTFVKPVYYASADPGSSDVGILQFLLDRGATVQDAYNNPVTHETLLQYIIKNRNQYKDANKYNKIVELIKQAEAREKAAGPAAKKAGAANPTKMTVEEATALLRQSILNGDMNGFYRAIAMGADVTAADKNGHTLLTNAILLDEDEMAEILINKGSDVKIVDKDGHTPLTLAVTKNKPALVRVLIDAGSDVNVVTKPGETPLSIAKRINASEIVKMLQTAGATK